MERAEEDGCAVGTRDHEIFLDKEVTVLMRDGKYFRGTLRSFDQFNNIALENMAECIFFGDAFAERPCGLNVIRGESIVFIGIPKVGFRYMRREKWGSRQEQTGDGAR